MSTHVLVALLATQHIIKRRMRGKLTPEEKSQVLTFVYLLTKDFLSTLNINESELGAFWLAISPHSNLCVSGPSDTIGQEEVPVLLQDDQVHTSLSRVPKGLCKSKN